MQSEQFYTLDQLKSKFGVEKGGQYFYDDDVWIAMIDPLMMSEKDKDKAIDRLKEVIGIKSKEQDESEAKESQTHFLSDWIKDNWISERVDFNDRDIRGSKFIWIYESQPEQFNELEIRERDQQLLNELL